MKKSVALFLTLIVFICTLPGNSYAWFYKKTQRTLRNTPYYKIDDKPDPVLINEGHSRSDATAGWTGVIGDEMFFETYGLNAHLSCNGKLTINIFTDIPQCHALTTKSDSTTYYFYMADFGLDLDQDGFFEYGIVLYDHRYWAGSEGNGLPTATDLAVGLYEVTAWDTSSDIFEEFTPDDFGGIGYGEQYDEFDPKVPVVAIAEGEKIADLKIRQMAPGNSEAQFKYSFTIDTEDIGGIGDYFDIFRAGSTCANDIIDATLKNCRCGFGSMIWQRD